MQQNANVVSAAIATIQLLETSSIGSAPGAQC